MRVEPAAERVGEQRQRLVGRQTELRAVVTGADRLVRVRVDAERDPHEDAPDAGARGQLRLVGRVDHDRRPCLRSRSEKRRALVVPVDDELGSREPGCERNGELTLRGDVGADSLLAEQAEQRHVGERLRPVDDPARTDGRAQPARTRTQRLLAVHDERCPEALDEGSRPQRRRAASSPSASRAESGKRSSIRRFCLLPSEGMQQLLA